MSEALPHEIVTVLGMTGSGKTRLIARHLGPRHARRVTIDVTGECRALYPDALHVQGLRATVRALHALHSSQHHRWHVVTAMERAEIGQLVTMFAPEFGAMAPSLSAAWGGVCLEAFELNLLAANGNMPPWMDAAYTKGRHYGFSVLGATQRPQMVSRIATAMSRWLVSFKMHESRDIAWCAERSERFAATVEGLDAARYQSAWLETTTGRVWLVDGGYRPVREIT